MKLRSLFASILASVALIGCVQEEFPALSNIEVTPSYFTLGVDGGTKEVKVTSAAAWEITDTLPSWLSVSTLKGNGSKDGEAVTVTVAASTDTLARTAYLKFTSGKETQLVTVNQDAFMPDFPEFKGGEYWIMTADRKSVVFPIDDGGNGYGYMNVVATIEGNSTAENIYTFTPVEGEAGGFTIVDTKGRYHIGSTYNSFTVSATNPADGSEVWYVKQVSATGHQIVNKKNTWAIVMSTYGNFCPYPEGHDKSTGELPFLVKVEEVAEEAPLGESMKINEALEYKPELIVEGLVTASSTKGAILTDKSGSILVYGLSSDVTVGDSIKVAGKLDIYNKGYQLKEPQRYELVDSVKHEVKYPKATELTKTSIPELVKSDFLAQYVSVKGIVSVDSYHNALIKVGGYTVKTYYSAEQYDALKDKAHEITGYLISYKESAKEANLIVTKVSEELKDFVPEVEEPETPGEGGETTDPENPGEGGGTDGGGDSSAKYVKVTSDQEDWSGKYLVVWETSAHSSFNGKKDLNATVQNLTITNNEILSTTEVDAAAFTVEKSGAAYSMKYPDGKYFAMAHNASSVSDEPFALGFEYSAEGIKISGTAKNNDTPGTYYLYWQLSSNGTSYYRCYPLKENPDTYGNNYYFPNLFKYTE